MPEETAPALTAETAVPAAPVATTCHHDEVQKTCSHGLSVRFQLAMARFDCS